ncbi:nucleotide exchange factor GrpE [Bowmanella sp. JS7-9]|uniref:Protein GrpE n=1 Tax=Pseudobowmanella zhangzhouensis TaxID=1537679 RepID=A0ABW1XJZ8_9ALTE|nr:nucleotide exchange factor GrpE [Bowmanella sp. JS7-9]TBX27577.1 heat shock protein GrpE [Bowmanella sp. JS7-9]
MSDKQPQNEEFETTQTQEVETDALETEGLTVEQAQIAELTEALNAAEAKLAEQKDSVLRALADAENTKRRAEGEVDKARKFALEKFAGELLPVLDNLERAIAAGNPDDDAVKPLLEGVELTLKTFISAIGKFNVETVDPQGQPFNPELHQAMSMVENGDVAPNTVIAVMQKGYTLNGRLLRPAMVMVSRAPEGGVDTTA